jgi:hypothetical protein
MAEYYGVRHLSPAFAYYVREFLDRTKPKAVLIEGPSDLSGLINGLCSPKVRLPAAILAYTTEPPVRTVLYPMAEFSPEYQAMMWAKKHKVPVEFCDLPSGSLLYREEKDEEESEEAENAESNETMIIYGISLLLIYLIMACLYNSLLIPFAVMLSIPFGLVGSYLAIKPLEVMGVGANIYVQTGVIMIIGLVAKTAILITEFAMQKHQEGLSVTDAALEACRDRLRPILMTVFAMIMGMVPLALGNGAGAIGNKSLALTVIGGMILGTIALLFITPAFYIIFQKLEDRWFGKN